MMSSLEEDLNHDFVRMHSFDENSPVHSKDAGSWTRASGSTKINHADGNVGNVGNVANDDVKTEVLDEENNPSLDFSDRSNGIGGSNTDRSLGSASNSSEINGNNEENKNAGDDNAESREERRAARREHRRRLRQSGGRGMGSLRESVRSRGSTESSTGCDDGINDSITSREGKEWQGVYKVIEAPRLFVYDESESARFFGASESTRYFDGGDDEGKDAGNSGIKNEIDGRDGDDVNKDDDKRALDIATSDVGSSFCELDSKNNSISDSNRSSTQDTVKMGNLHQTSSILDSEKSWDMAASSSSEVNAESSLYANKSDYAAQLTRPIRRDVVPQSSEDQTDQNYRFDSLDAAVDAVNSMTSKRPRRGSGHTNTDIDLSDHVDFGESELSIGIDDLTSPTPPTSQQRKQPHHRKQQYCDSSLGDSMKQYTQNHFTQSDIELEADESNIIKETPARCASEPIESIIGEDTPEEPRRPSLLDAYEYYNGASLPDTIQEVHPLKRVAASNPSIKSNISQRKTNRRARHSNPRMNRASVKRMDDGALADNLYHNPKGSWMGGAGLRLSLVTATTHSSSTMTSSSKITSRRNSSDYNGSERRGSLFGNSVMGRLESIGSSNQSYNQSDTSPSNEVTACGATCEPLQPSPPSEPSQSINTDHDSTPAVNRRVIPPFSLLCSPFFKCMSPRKNYNRRVSTISTMDNQYFIPPPQERHTFIQSLWNAVHGFGVDFIVWIYQASFLTVLFIFLIGYYTLVFSFAGILVGMESKTDGRCGLDMNQLWSKSEEYELAFELSWTTFTTVGYGLVSPSGEEYQCYPIRFVCALFAFLGLLFNSLSAAIFFSKLERMLTRASVTFSSSVCLQFGKQSSGVRGSRNVYGQFWIRQNSDFLSVDESEGSTSGSKRDRFDSLSSFGSSFKRTKDDMEASDGSFARSAAAVARKYPYPFLEFRIVNDHANVKNRAIWNAQVTAMVQLSAKDIEKSRGHRYGPSVGDTFREYVTPSASSHGQHASTPNQNQAKSNRPEGDLAESLTETALVVQETDTGTGKGAHPEGRVYFPLVLEPASHPYFRRVWYLRHTLNERSPLLKHKVRERIKKNKGWDPALCQYQDILEQLVEFHRLRITFKGTSAVSNSVVYAQKVYTMQDVFVGWQFGQIFYEKEKWRLFRGWRTGSSNPVTAEEENEEEEDDDNLLLDKRLIHDIIPQPGGNHEPIEG